MICPICDGKGYVYNALGDFNEDCVYCQRKGRVRADGEPQTNEELVWQRIYSKKPKSVQRKRMSVQKVHER